MYFRGVVLKVEEWKFIDLFVGCHWYILQSFAVVFRPYGLIPPKLKKKKSFGFPIFLRQKTRRCRFHYNLTHTKNRKKTLSYQITITIFRLFCFKVYNEYSTTTVQHYYIRVG